MRSTTTRSASKRPSMPASPGAEAAFRPHSQTPFGHARRSETLFRREGVLCGAGWRAATAPTPQIEFRPHGIPKRSLGVRNSHAPFSSHLPGATPRRGGARRRRAPAARLGAPAAPRRAPAAALGGCRTRLWAPATPFPAPATRLSGGAKWLGGGAKALSGGAARLSGGAKWSKDDSFGRKWILSNRKPAASAGSASMGGRTVIFQRRDAETQRVQSFGCGLPSASSASRRLGVDQKTPAVSRSPHATSPHPNPNPCPHG